MPTPTRTPWLTWLDGVLLLPLAYVGSFFFYVSVLAGPGQCGSQHPDLCFGFGILGMLVAPVAMLTTPLVLVRLAWRGVARWRSRPPPLEP